MTLSFLTVGIQSAVNFAAGVLRMPVARYEVAAVTGSLAWAAIYTTIGFAAVEAWLGQAGTGWLLAAVVAVGMVVLLTQVARRRLRKETPAGDDPADDDRPHSYRRGVRI